MRMTPPKESHATKVETRAALLRNIARGCAIRGTAGLAYSDVDYRASGFARNGTRANLRAVYFL